MSNTEGTPVTPVRSQAANDPFVAAAQTTKPIDTILQLNGKPAQEAVPILSGIAALMNGNSAGAWTEPYLNDVARLAWAKQEYAAGRNVDPRDAPTAYLEAWKDAFFGSDTSVPLIKEVDQQMIDYGVQKAQSTGRPFDWRDAFGQTGEGGLISKQVASNDCGPNSAANVLRSLGYNADPASLFEYAKAKGYHNGEEFTGPYNFARMLTQEAGIDAKALPMDWAAVDAELDAGRVVVVSSRGHYWTIASRRDGPNGVEYYTGATGSVVGNPEWSTAGQIRHGGTPDTMIVTRGSANPNAPVVQALGLKPPAPGMTRNRALLSTLTNRSQAPQAPVRTNMNQQTTGTAPTSDENLVFQLAGEENADPVLILAMMDQESGGDQSAVSPMGARGKMQLMPATARELGVNPDDPVDNVRGGIRYFKKMLDRYGDIDLALAAYNAGPGAVDAYGGIPPYAETQEYVQKVKANLQRRLNQYAGIR
jgi:hypothetical protein